MFVRVQPLGNLVTSTSFWCSCTYTLQQKPPFLSISLRPLAKFDTRATPYPFLPSLHRWSLHFLTVPGIPVPESTINHGSIVELSTTYSAAKVSQTIKGVGGLTYDDPQHFPRYSNLTMALARHFFKNPLAGSCSPQPSRSKILNTSSSVSSVSSSISAIFRNISSKAGHWAEYLVYKVWKQMWAPSVIFRTLLEVTVRRISSVKL